MNVSTLTDSVFYYSEYRLVSIDQSSYRVVHSYVCPSLVDGSAMHWYPSYSAGPSLI